MTAESAEPEDAARPAAENPNEALGHLFFAEKILPVLESRCFECHSAGAATIESGLRLDLKEGLLKGGEYGPAVVPGNVRSSLLLSAIRHEDLVMPPDGEKLPDNVIADFVRWIEMGAPDPRESSGEALHAFDFSTAREFWVFQPIERVPPPEVAYRDWPTNWIDNFVAAKLEANGLAPAPPAQKLDLVRRLYFDLTGLPPTPDQVAAFLADDSPDAYEKLVDTLLASPRYGERAAQHWLDLVRFAESEGFEYDRHLPEAWRYRDYVIKSFNEDKPYNRFLSEHVAGDELAADETGEERIEALTGAVFHRLGAVRRNAGNQLVAASRNEVLTERTDIIGAAFMGLTIGCARCHDHKFDAIPQKDYYRLQAFLAMTEENNAPIGDSDNVQEIMQKRRELSGQLRRLKRQARALRGEEKVAADEEIARLEAELPPEPSVVPTVMNDMENRTDIHVLVRGEWERKGDPVGPRGMSVLMGPDAPDLSPDMQRPRTQLAKWLTEDAQMVTARVFVNRLWQYYLGEGIVPTANNFGKNGELPTHPELLDALTDEFIQYGWHSKPLIRMILLSSTYRQASTSPLEAVATTKDPQNRLLWKFNRRRLSAEEIRDSMLSISGRLNPKAGGPSIIVPVEPDLVNFLYHPEQWEVTADPTEHDRRSVYLISKRNLRLPFMEVFDQPIAQISCPQRDTTTHAPQALELLNGTLTNSVAESLAERLLTECGTDPNEQVQRAFLLAAGRAPTDAEKALAVEFLQENSLREFALAVLNLNEFLYVD